MALKENKSLHVKRLAVVIADAEATFKTGFRCQGRLRLCSALLDLDSLHNNNASSLAGKSVCKHYLWY